MTADLFQKITASAALEAGAEARIICHLEQAPDHPTLLSVPETFYLKGLVTCKC
jgi:23S rRNA (cytosine1962-C5)-methyltransferase